MKNAEAIEVTLGYLEEQGRIQEQDAALVQMLRSMAATLDVKPTNSQMWREYREAIRELLTDERDDDQIDKLLDQLRSPLRNAETT